MLARTCAGDRRHRSQALALEPGVIVKKSGISTLLAQMRDVNACLKGSSGATDVALITRAVICCILLCGRSEDTWRVSIYIFQGNVDLMQCIVIYHWWDATMPICLAILRAPERVQGLVSPQSGRPDVECMLCCQVPFILLHALQRR